MKFMQTLDILLLKKSISNVQFWYFFKKILYKLDTQIDTKKKIDIHIFSSIRYPNQIKKSGILCAR